MKQVALVKSNNSIIPNLKLSGKDSPDYKTLRLKAINGYLSYVIGEPCILCISFYVLGPLAFTKAWPEENILILRQRL